MTAAARRRRVVLALESSGPGGAENMVLRLAEGLRGAGEEPIVATLRPGWMTERAEAAGLPVWIVPQRPGLDLGWVPAFAWRLRRERVDVLHSHEFMMNVYGGAAARLAGVASVATVHGHQWATGKPRRALAYRMLRRLGLRLVAVSADLAGFLSTGLGLPRSALAVVPNGIPLPRLPDPSRAAELRAAARAELGLPPDGALAVAVGNLYPVKGHGTLVAALAEAPGVRAAIAGRGEEESRLREEARRLGVSGRLHLLGLRDDVDRVLRAADVFVHPSRLEGLPLAILEAMAAALPVVASRVGGIPEAVIDGETGVLVPPGEPGTLAEALRSVLLVPGRAAALGAAGRARAERHFSIEAMISAYRSLYDDAAGRRAGGA